MNPDQRQRQMLASLPLLLQEGANVGELYKALARVLSGEPEDGGMEHGITRLLRSRWYRFAQGWTGDQTPAASELGRIGALYGFAPAGHAAPDAFRRRLAEFIAIHREGLTTTSAVLRLVALVYMAEATPRITWHPADAKVRARFPGAEFARATFTALAGGELGEVAVELHENPSSPSVARFTDINAQRRLTVVNAGLDPATPELRLRPRGGHALSPVFINMSTGLRLIFVGVVPKDTTLTLREGLPPLLDGVPRPECPVLLSNPFTFNAPNAKFTSNNVGARFSIREKFRMPLLNPGESAWRYDVMSQSELGALVDPDFKPKDGLPADPVPKAPNADLELRWDETLPAAFTLRIPADRVPAVFLDPATGVPDLPALVRELEWALCYGRAAGVRSRVELALPHVHEELELAETLTMRADLRNAETEQLAESAPSPVPGVALKDTLTPPDDPLKFGGIFDTTPFDTSLFK